MKQNSYARNRYQLIKTYLEYMGVGVDNVLTIPNLPDYELEKILELKAFLEDKRI